MNRNGRLTWNHDDAEGGVTAAAIETEAEDTPVDPEGDAAFWRARAEKAEKERDKWRKIASDAEKDADEAEENLLAFKAARAFSDPRPLTPDDIERGVDMLRSASASIARDLNDAGQRATVQAIVKVVLTPPPSRPEGAEDVEVVLRRAQNITGIEVDEGDLADLADALAERGVRVTGAGQ